MLSNKIEITATVDDVKREALHSRHDCVMRFALLNVDTSVVAEL